MDLWQGLLGTLKLVAGLGENVLINVLTDVCKLAKVCHCQA